PASLLFLLTLPPLLPLFPYTTLFRSRSGGCLRLLPRLTNRFSTDTSQHADCDLLASQRNAARRALANSCAKLVGPCVGGVPYASFRSAKDRHTRDLRARMVCRKYRRGTAGGYLRSNLQERQALVRKRLRCARFLDLWCFPA